MVCLSNSTDDVTGDIIDAAVDAAVDDAVDAAVDAADDEESAVSGSILKSSSNDIIYLPFYGNLRGNAYGILIYHGIIYSPSPSNKNAYYRRYAKCGKIHAIV